VVECKRSWTRQSGDGELTTASNLGSHLLDQASKFTPGGVNTSLRRLEPGLVFTRAAGAIITDTDGKQYILRKMS
jgi:glutamate-1-semialdehyde aminotransferase